MVGAFFLLFIGVPILLAVALGAAFPHRPIRAGLASIGILATWLLIENRAHGLVAMLPFTLFVSAMALVPAIISAYFGAGIRLRLGKEN